MDVDWRCRMSGEGESDALIVARWLWPDRAWTRTPSGVAESRPYDGLGERDGDSFDPAIRSHVAAAEVAMVERGLGERYARALLREIASSAGTHDFGSPGAYYGDIARIRTAPLSAIVRALATVAREEERPDA
jgi:hypothetical protein